MQAVDRYIPTPERAVARPFLMPIEDVFGIKGRGTVVTGRIERGVIKPGEEVEIVGLGGPTRRTVVTGVEMFRRLLDQGEAGTMWAACCGGSSGRTWSGGRCWPSRGPSSPTPAFGARCMS